MARTAPVPNIPAIPGMNPGLFVMGGGGDGGGSGEGGGDGKGGKQGADGKNGGKDAKGGGKGADACGAGSGSGCSNPAHGGAGTAAGDPVDFTSGRVYTIAAPDLVLPGPLTFVLERTYDSTRRDHDIGLGHGWTHSLAWQLHAGRRRLQLTTGSGVHWELPLPEVGGSTQVEDMLVQRDRSQIRVTVGSRALTYIFEPLVPIPENEPPPSPVGQYLLMAVVDPYSNGLRLSYENGLLVGFVDSAGRAVRVRRSGLHITAFEVKYGDRFLAYRTYEHDQAGNLTAARDGYGHPVRYTYDEDHLLTSQTMPEGMSTYWRYDERGRCFETWCERPGPDLSIDEAAPRVLADGSTRAKGVLHCKIEYADDYVEVTTSRSLRRYFVRNGVVEKTVFMGAVSENHYDSLGNLVEYVDAAGNAWRWTYDARGRKTSETSPLGDLCTWDYGDDGLLRRMEFPTGFTEYLRNKQGDMVRASDSLGLVVSYERDVRGLVTAATTPAGKTVMEYDAMGNRVRVREPNGAERKIAYDYLGQPLSMVDENGHETRYHYGAARELLAVLMPDGSTVEYNYDADGLLCGINTPLGRYELRWGGHEVVHELKKPDGNLVRFRYDRECALVRVINEADEEHVIERDGEGRVVGEKTFDGRRQRFSVDAMGRVVKVTGDSGDVTEIEYDAVGRIAKRTLPDETVETFTYDWMGKVLTGDNGTVVCTFDYDARGRCVKETQAYAGATETVESTFGAVMRGSLRTSRGYEQLTTWTPMGLPHEIRLPGAPAPISFQWDGADHEVQRALPGGATINSAYDPMGRLMRRAVYSPQRGPLVGPNEPDWVGRRPGLLVEQSFEYIPGTELPSFIHDNIVGSIELQHDPMGQLRARMPKGLPAETFAYLAGERVVDDGIKREYDAGGLLVRRGETSFVYDAERRLLEKRMTPAVGPASVWKYEWNGAGLLSAVTTPDGTRVTHVYDTFARRIEKRVIGPDGTVTKIRYVWDGDLQVHELTRRTKAGSDAVAEAERTFAFTRTSRSPLAHRDSAGDWVYYLTDSTGRAQTLLDDRGTALAMFDTKAFGRVKPLGAPRATTNARFVGHWEDEETGLFYNRHRFYDPDTGRYMSPEPLGLSGGLSTFGYARNRPFDYVDPDGLLGMIASGPGAAPRGSASTEGIPSSDVMPGLHPVVQQALANPSLANSWGQPRSPAACAEPRHLSDYLYNHQPPVDPNNPASVQAALQNYKVQASQANNGKPRAPCPNCSQMFANLMAKYGAPDPNNIGAGGTAANSLPANYVNFTPPPAGAAGQGPGGQAFTSYNQALQQFANCLGGDVRIHTTEGEIPVRELSPAALVWTLTEDGERCPVPLHLVNSSPAPVGHVMRRLLLDDGRTLCVSAPHPIADGTPVGDLEVGDTLDGAVVILAETVPYSGVETFDLLPKGATGCYWANGVLLGSTLFDWKAKKQASIVRGPLGNQKEELRP
ncbi:MAG: RHS repeat-associated core domain-containing protein [Polyangiaceae bacterium]